MPQVENQTHVLYNQVEGTDPAVTERLREVVSCVAAWTDSIYNRKQKEVKVECEDRIQVTAPNYFPIKPEEKDKRLSGVYSTRM